MQKGKVGLALGSGAARGLAHIGVLEVLEKEGIPIDMIAGTSAGALIGALYAQGKNVDQIKDLAIEQGSKRFSLLGDLTLPKTGLIRGRRIEGMLRSIMGDLKLEDLRMPFTCVATDIVTGEEVVIRKGLVWKGVRASVSVPVILTVARWEGRYLVDGALVNPVPVSVLKEMGANYVIAVNVTPDVRERIHRVSEERLETKEPNIFNVLMQTVYIAGCQAVRSSLVGADVIIEPLVTHIGWGDFHRVQECILQGELATQSSIPEIKRQLKA